MAQDFNKICVRTHLKINGEDVNWGSGIIIKDGDQYFVITAQHCIYGNEGQFKGISKEKIIIEYQDTYISPFRHIFVEAIIKASEHNDWILLKVKDPNIEAIQFVKLKNFPRETYVKFRGYQNEAPNRFRTFPAKIKEISDEQFSIHLTEDAFETGGEQGSYMAKGLSGSGVYIEDKGKVYLLGILTSVVGELALNNDIDCTPICLLDEVMSEESRNFEDLSIFRNINKKNPYKGLAAFDVDDGDYFFGRNKELESCFKEITINGSTFISVIGSSGTGKSSFVRAGMLYAFKKREELGFLDYLQIIVTPGNEPYTNLKYQLKLNGISHEDLISENSKAINLILFFDQFEEIITQCNSPEAIEERKEFFKFLDALIANENPNLKLLVITTYRAEFISQLVNYDFIKNHQTIFSLSSLDYKIHVPNWQHSIEEIITGPALKNGVIIEKELVDQLINQIKEVDGSLSILQFTLQRIWDDQSIVDGLISTKEYSQLSEGKGIAGIIETHAEEVIKRITNNGNYKEKEAVLKSILVNLVEVNENLLDVKRTVAKDELFSILKVYPKNIVIEVFEAMVSEKSRLLHVSESKDASINVSIIHEVLIRKWGHLRNWIDERREALQYKKRLTLDITEFKKGEEKIYRGKKLKRANEWKIKNPDLTNDEINAFLKKAKKKKKNKRYKFLGASLLFFVLLYIVYFIAVPYYEKENFLKEIVKYPSLHEQVLNVGGIDSLRHLTIDDGTYGFLTKKIKFFKKIHSIKIRDLSSVKDLSFLKNIKNAVTVNSLSIEYNNGLTNLVGVENLTALTSLSIENNQNLTSLAGVENLTALNSLFIYKNQNLTSLEGIENLEILNSLSVEINDGLTSLGGIENLTSLTSLSIGGNTGLTNLAGIESLTALNSLTIHNSGSLTSLERIKSLTILDTLSIQHNYNLISLDGIENLKDLKSLSLIKNVRLTSLEGIEDLPALNSLSIWANGSLTSLKGIENLPALNSLKIHNIHLTSLEGIENLPALDTLSIQHNYNMTHLKGIENLTTLNSLIIWANNSLTNLEGIENLTSLNSLRIIKNNSLTSLAAIKNLPALSSLSVENNYNLTSLEGIENLKNLTSLEILDNASLRNLNGIELPSKLKILIIDEDFDINWNLLKKNNPELKIRFY